mgnify:CR=1 FL=1|jgi:hypothetical protein
MSDGIEEIIKRIRLPLKISHYDLINHATVDNVRQEPHEEPWEGLCGYHAIGDVSLTISKDMIDYTQEALCKFFNCKIYNNDKKI